MKVYVILACIATLAVADQATWEKFKIGHNKTFKSIIEERHRYKIFQNNLKEIQEHNAKYDQGLVSFKKGINQFADMTKAEFLAFLKLSGPDENSSPEKIHVSVKSAPTEIDWRISGAVTPVKDQGLCGACWSFSTTGSLEGQYKITTGKLVSLSEQNLIDCTQHYGNAGCRGGFMYASYKYVRLEGINSEADYPFEGVDGNCRFNSDAIVLKASGFVKINKDIEDDLINAIGTIGPISVSIEATSDLQLYKSGIYDSDECLGNLNHGVLAVGYTNDTIIIKNSWGASWGESGYVRFVRGKNLCGISTSATYPTL